MGFNGFFSYSGDHKRDVAHVINGWRVEYEYNAQDLDKDFITDCAGSRALDNAKNDSTLLLWMHEAQPENNARSPRDTRVGFIGAILHRGRRSAQYRLEIQRIYVKPTHRCRGVALALLRALCSDAAGSGATHVSLSSGLRNQHQSQRFWLKVGYTLAGEHVINDTVLPIRELNL